MFLFFFHHREHGEVWRTTEGLGWLGSFFHARHSFFYIVRSYYLSPKGHKEGHERIGELILKINKKYTIYNYDGNNIIFSHLVNIDKKII